MIGVLEWWEQGGGGLGTDSPTRGTRGPHECLSVQPLFLKCRALFVMELLSFRAAGLAGGHCSGNPDLGWCGFEFRVRALCGFGLAGPPERTVGTPNIESLAIRSVRAGPRWQRCPDTRWEKGIWILGDLLIAWHRKKRFTV